LPRGLVGVPGQWRDRLAGRGARARHGAEEAAP